MQHLFFLCPAAAHVWRTIGIDLKCLPFTDIWDTNLPQALPPIIWNSVCLIILWKIWDARNAMVFRQVDQETSSTIRNILSDLTLWSHCFKKTEQKVAADLWRDHLSLCTM
jgi:hypothetical protein